MIGNYYNTDGGISMKVYFVYSVSSNEQYDVFTENISMDNMGRTA